MGPKPIVCAINGNCLGGGLEFAMACHYRLAAPRLNLGQPEVQIGLIPGAGGTQRLPRLIGLPGAIEMITVGRPIKSEVALSRGLINEVVPADQLVDKAVAAARRFISGELRLDDRRTRNRFTRLPSAAEKTYVCNGARFMTYQQAKDHYPAPYKAIDAIDHGLSFDIEADIEREVELGGAIHSKGVMILAAYLAAHYAPERPLSLRATLVFEQSYGGVDGDSASVAELVALLSALADAPVRQSLAVTGSVNQHGEVQAIGGVNEKIEGFFDICNQRGLTGEQGVLGQVRVRDQIGDDLVELGRVRPALDEALFRAAHLGRSHHLHRLGDLPRVFDGGDPPGDIPKARHLRPLFQ